MPLLRKIARGTRIAWIFTYSLTGLLLRRPQARRDRAQWLSTLCRRVLRAAQVDWSSLGPVPMTGAVVSNHLSYLDILLHAAVRPCVFVSAIETRKMPLIGWMSMMAGTVYVTRGAGGSAAQAASGMAEGFHDGLPVVFFPEGKTGVGDVPLLPLHTGLLANALQAGATVTPAFLRYSLSEGDLAAGRTTREDVAWSHQSLPAHLWNLLGLQPFVALIRFAEQPVPFSPEAQDDRQIAAEETRQALLEVAENASNSN